MIKSNTLKTVIILSVLFIIISTVNVLTITNNPKWFSIDYVSRNQEIISYATLIGAILSFISILLILANIIEQKKQYENDKLLVKNKEVLRQF